MNFDDQNSNGDEGENIQNMLDDLGLGQENNLPELSKKDSTVFIIDCSRQINMTFQGEEESQLKMIFDGYSNFLQRKIIANAGDQVGLILYNVNFKHGSNFQNIFVVHKLALPSANTIKEANNLHKTFQTLTGGFSQKKATLQHVFWTYSDQIKKMTDAKYYLRLFLFTADDNPHAKGNQERNQAINQARMLSERNVQIQLFPLRRQKSSIFRIANFYQQIITFDPDEINQAVLDSSSKILDLKQRLRQKQFKKRTLNRLLMKIGNDTQIGVKLYALYTKAKRPVPKKVDARTNKFLQRVTKKLNRQGKVMFQAQIGTYYPLGGQKVKFSKQDMNKVKNIQPPGMTLIGFKPKKYIKPYHNLRTSYFLYPDEQHVSGSSQFCDSLINQLVQRQLVGIVKIVPRNNQQMSFAALFPQKESYDQQTHFQTPPGFNMVILPYADDIVNFVGDKTICRPMQISEQLVSVTSLLVNNLTIHDFDFRSFQNPSLQKFYSHLQALALGEKNVEVRPDLLQPDTKGLQNYAEIIDLLMETAKADAEYFAKKQQQNGMELQQIKPKKQQQDYYNDVKNKQVQKKSKVKGGAKNAAKKKVKYQQNSQSIPIQDDSDSQFNQKDKKKGSKSNGNTKKGSKKQQSINLQDNQQGQSSSHNNIAQQVEASIINGDLDSLKVSDLKAYLKLNGLSDKGKRDQLVNRVLFYISDKQSI